MTICERMFSIIDSNPKKNAAGLCKVLNIGTSVTSGWKSRNADPPAKYITQICEYLDVSVFFLLTGEDNSMNGLSADESRIISKYRTLDEDGRDAVRGVLLNEQRRIEANKKTSEQAVS